MTHEQQSMRFEPLDIEEQVISQVNNQQELEILEAEQIEQELQESSQRMINLLNLEQPQIINDLKIVKNPISPYMVFVTSWKVRHPDEKFNMSTLGQIWRTMILSEKEPFETEYKLKRKEYEIYQAAKLISNPSDTSKNFDTPKYVFPLHRIQSILRQDNYYKPKVEATSSFTHATEYFAEFMLQQIKKLTDGKNRIDSKVLYDCINNNRSFSFLQCLIQDYNKESGIKEKRIKPEVALEFEDAPKPHQERTNKIQAKQIKSGKKPAQWKAPMGQMSLDSFVNKQR